MASSCQLEKVLPSLALAGVGLGVIIAKRIKVVDYFIKEYISRKKDYINCLPDDILCHIISYLDMRDAVRTSVLSRRWRNLYCTRPNRKFKRHEIIEFLSRTKRINCHRNYKPRFAAAVDEFLRVGFGLWRWLADIVRNPFSNWEPIDLVQVIVGLMLLVVESIYIYYSLVRIRKDIARAFAKAIEEVAQAFASALDSFTIFGVANALMECLKESLSISITRAANALKETLKQSSSIIGAHLLRALQEFTNESCDLDKAPFCPFS